MVGSCLLSIFSSGTDSGHLEESENHYSGLLVKSADCIGYHRAVPHRETAWWGWRMEGAREENVEGRHQGWHIVREGEKLRLTEVKHAFLHRRLNYSQLTMSFMWMCLVSQKQRHPHKVMQLRVSVCPSEVTFMVVWRTTFCMQQQKL